VGTPRDRCGRPLRDQRVKTLQCWFEPFVRLRASKLVRLRRDPFEHADENSNACRDWMIPHIDIVYAMQAVVAGQL